MYVCIFLIYVPIYIYIYIYAYTYIYIYIERGREIVPREGGRQASPRPSRVGTHTYKYIYIYTHIPVSDK